MSIEGLIAATPPRKSKRKKPTNEKRQPKYDKSPHLMATVDKWIAFFMHSNAEQVQVLRLRLERLYQLTYQIEQSRPSLKTFYH